MENILFAIDTKGPGGAETIFLQLIRAVNANGYHPFAILGGKGWVYDEVAKAGIGLEVVNNIGSFNFKYFIKLIKCIRKYKIKLIHSHLLGSNLYCSIAGYLCGVPVISTFHGTVDCDMQRRKNRIKLKIITRGSKYIVFVSEYLKEYFSREVKIDDEKCAVIYNGIDFNKYYGGRKGSLRKSLGLSENDFVIGSIGNMRESKGYDLLLKAASMVIEKISPCRFIVVGEGGGQLMRTLFELREKLKLEEQFQFLGFRDDIPDILMILDLFVLPSRTEGLSLATIEAMAAGIPTIATDSGGPREIITDSLDGILIKREDEEEIAKVILRCHGDHALRRRLSENCRSKVKNKFGLERMINNYLELYGKANAV